MTFKNSPCGNEWPLYVFLYWPSKIRAHIPQFEVRKFILTRCGAYSRTGNAPLLLIFPAYCHVFGRYSSFVGGFIGCVVVGVFVPPVVGLTGNFAQYFCNCWEIKRFVCSLCLRPVFAAAILSRCACGISLRHCLLLIVQIFYSRYYNYCRYRLYYKYSSTIKNLFWRGNIRG